MSNDISYTIAELANLGGVSRRTVHYYIQENLLPIPMGAGRGSHYGREHLDQLLKVKAMQETGLSLMEIRRRLATGDRRQTEATDAMPVSRTHWTRIELVPGLELHVAGNFRIPPPARLEELAGLCRRAFTPRGFDTDESIDKEK